VKGSGVSPAEVGLFPASTSEETAEKEGTRSRGQQSQGLGDSEGCGGHLLPHASSGAQRASRHLMVSWWPRGCATSSPGHHAGKRGRRNTARHETDTRAPASKPAARRGSTGG
jgi:hypothetical protein